jgi:hypothetical protein
MMWCRHTWQAKVLFDRRGIQPRNLYLSPAALRGPVVFAIESFATYRSSEENSLHQIELI